MSVLQYLKQRYPSGKIKATRDYLVAVELLTRGEAKELNDFKVNGYVDVEFVADIIDSD